MRTWRGWPLAWWGRDARNNGPSRLTAGPGAPYQSARQGGECSRRMVSQTKVGSLKSRGWRAHIGNVTLWSGPDGMTPCLYSFVGQLERTRKLLCSRAGSPVAGRSLASRRIVRSISRCRACLLLATGVPHTRRTARQQPFCPPFSHPSWGVFLTRTSLRPYTPPRRGVRAASAKRPAQARGGRHAIIPTRAI